MSETIKPLSEWEYEFCGKKALINVSESDLTLIACDNCGQTYRGTIVEKAGGNQ